MVIADLHIHSRYSRATSRECDPEHLELWARRKGIGLLGTGDFTHPAWREELKEKLRPAEEGLYTLKEEYRLESGLSRPEEAPRFVISGEISSIYKKNGRVRKVHNLILLPGLEEAEAIARKLEAIGNIHSDGRPILGLDSRDLLEIVLETCSGAVFIPAHIWTPHFSLFGAFSGFDTIEECFEDLAPYIHALETGLSSDPPMNWRLSALDQYRLVSNSDAHSPAKLGREANLLDIDLNYPALSAALNDPASAGLRGTIEFFPEEGKYHLDGHRACRQCLTPSETDEAGGRCPVCGRKLTIGVLHRVEQLADRPEGFALPGARPFENLIPLLEVIGASTGMSAGGVRAAAQYEAMLRELGPEFYILRKAPLEAVEKAAGPCVAVGIRRMRGGNVRRVPGYDGEYGKIQLLTPEEIEALNGQMFFFSDAPAKKGKKAPAAKKAKGSAEDSRVPEALPSPPAGGAASGLNAEQQQAVTAADAAIAVIAGPGTGKTRTLVARILHLVKDLSVKPSDITAVTFTNKAAGEMRERLEQALGDKRAVRKMTIGTFHAIARTLLEEHGLTVSLVDRADAEDLAAAVLRECGGGKKLSSSRFLEAVSRYKNGLSAEEGLSPFFEAYQRRLQERGLLDFDDLLFKAWETARQGVEKRERFSHLLVDEFQDVNDIQYRLLRAWQQGGNGSLFVIGDPDQAIYGFRGADAHCFERLEADYPALRFVRLTYNYRSVPAVLRCALPVIEKSPLANGQRSLAPLRKERGSARLVEAADHFSEAVFVAKEINRLVGGMDMLDAQAMRARQGPLGFSDIAVLYRTHRQAEVLEACLKKEGIPYVVNGRESFLSDPSVRSALSFFHSLLESGDGNALFQSLTARTSLEEEKRQALLTYCRAEPAEMHRLRLEAPQSWLGMLPASLRRLEPVQKWAELAERFLLAMKKKPAALLGDWIEAAGLKEGEALAKLRNMAVFHASMPDFLWNLTTGEEGDLSRSGGKVYHADSVTLTTLHGSKGLEFPVVFICGVSKGRLPLERPGEAIDLAEERRLFYVGMTRAREELILLTGEEPSAFLSDIPPGCLEKGRAAETSYPYAARQMSLFD